MKHTMRRTTCICLDHRRRMVLLRSMQLMVINGVVRRAEVDPPRPRTDCENMHADIEASISSTPPASLDVQGWFIRLFRRPTDVLIHHARHSA